MGLLGFGPSPGHKAVDFLNIINKYLTQGISKEFLIKNLSDQSLIVCFQTNLTLIEDAGIDLVICGNNVLYHHPHNHPPYDTLFTIESTQ